MDSLGHGCDNAAIAIFLSCLMVTTTLSASDPRYRSSPGEGFDGVVRLSLGGYSATGVLLYDGRALLTAAHFFDGAAGTASVIFSTVSGQRSLAADRVLLHPDYDSQQGSNDLALVWLDGVPVDADRYSLYRDSDELGQNFLLVGYGASGTGTEGASSGSDSQRLQAMNRFDGEGAQLKQVLGAGMAWSPPPGSQLLADFDNGQGQQDALGLMLGRHHLGLGADEGLIAQGDSGGPAFIDGLLAGIATYTASLSYQGQDADVDQYSNSSFGELAAWQRTSHYQQWIDQSLRAAYVDAPRRPGEVVKAVMEGDSGTSLVYFLVQFLGQRDAPDQVVSVDYATRDGSATAGSDYLPVSGRLNLYPDESQAVIPVEILGDTLAEPDETFYLDIFNPVGGSFGPGVVRLTAMRTILDDDGWLG